MKKIIVANWKMNPQNKKEAEQIFNSIKKLGLVKNAEIVICPPFIYLSSFKLQVIGFKIGAQDCFWEEKGAFTGEVSALMLKDAGCQYVIAGHSERRKYFGETNEIVNKKVKAILNAGLSPIVCVGETQEQRNKGEIEEILKEQIKKAFEGISSSKLQVSRFIIAYEPVWAIGTGNGCSVEESQKMRLFIIKTVAEIYSQKIAKKIKILYGGSVNSENSAGYLKEAGFFGLLVGGASLNAEEFGKIIKNTI